MVRVSVITPVRDMRAYLGEAIASVQAQTFGDWEMLIIDDGSSDGSGELAREAAGADPRIRTLACPEPIGAAAARNLGLAHARGEFIAFLDADDLFDPNKLQVDLSAIAKHPTAAMVYGPTLWWWRQPGRESWLEPVRRVAGRLHAPPRLFRQALVDQTATVPCTCAVLIRRAAVAAVGGFEEAFRLYEDQTLWAKLMLRWPVFVHAEPTSRYRQHEGSTSAEAIRNGSYDPNAPHLARLEFLSWAGREAEAAGVADRAVRRALRLAFAAYPESRPPLTRMDRAILVGRRLRASAARQGRKLAWLRRRLLERAFASAGFPLSLDR